MRKTWMLASALLLAGACNEDDEQPLQPVDGGQDAAATGDAARVDGSASDAGDIDSGLGADAGHIDAGDLDAAPSPLDAMAPLDAAPADAARDASPDAAVVPPLAVIGRWHTQLHYVETITATAWTGATVVEYDNTARVAYVQSAATQTDPVAGFGQYVWTPIVNNAFWYCKVATGKPSLAAAKATPEVPDATDPAHSGCGGGRWTAMGPVIEIEGVYTTDEGTLAITSDQLGDNVIESYDNPSQTAIIGVVGEGDAGVQSYRKLVWTTPVTNKIYGCYVASGFASAELASASNATADATQLQTGCNGGAWISLTKQ